MIGTMDKRVHVQKRTVSRVNGVRSKGDWNTLWIVYGALRPLRGDEVRIAEQNGLVASHMVTIRYRNDFDGGELTPDMRFMIDSRLHEIRSIINPDFRNKVYQVMTEVRL